MTTNPKARVQAKRLLQLVTLNTVYAHYVEQQHNAMQAGKIRKPIPKPKLQALAMEYYSQMKSELRNCESVVDVRLVTNDIIRELGPTRTGFLKADWKGSRKATMDALK